MAHTRTHSAGGSTYKVSTSHRRSVQGLNTLYSKHELVQITDAAEFFTGQLANQVKSLKDARQHT